MGEHHILSPSSLCRRFHCPASRWIEGNIEGEFTSEAAEAGTRIHAAVAAWINAGRPDDYGVRLDDNAEQELFEDCCGFLMANVAKAAPIEAETRLELKDAYGEIVTFGTADVVFRDADGLWTIIDWKTGRGEIDPAESNWQGAAYAAMLAQRERAEKVRVVFYQPALKKHTAHDFTRDELQEARHQILNITLGSRDCFKAGSRCQYCKGRLSGRCNLARYEVEKSLFVPDELQIGEMSDWLLGDEYRRAAGAVAYCEQLKAEIQRRCRERGEACGYTLKPKQGARTICDAQAAFERVQGTLGQADFLQCVSVSLGDLERRYWEAERATRPADKITLKQARQDLESALGDAVQRKPETFTLTPIKEAEK